MKNNEASLFIFMACIIVGILISLNINFNRTNNRVFLSTKQYQDANEAKNKLIGEISDLDQQSLMLNSKLSKYKSAGKNQTTVISSIENELDQNKMQIGEEDVKGEGIIITLKDVSNESYYNIEDPNLIDKIIHNSDLYNIINDLRNAGAEAISINGQRVTDRTSVYCDGTLIAVNGVKITTPFYINAIGDKDILKNYMLSDDNSYLKFMMDRTISVNIEQSMDIKIQAASFDITKDFLSPSITK
ncbi:DUF881 domain-containing protein [Candidatus Clostridium radicumherbarum]|uniref:DUF881 domain-containing protein n=1 Tax=Candidatus Clostridium radicumherbarum TaxID=3381662 RepID=A0ABW8TX38_9CLOT